jgi:hypothetical protein
VNNDDDRGYVDPHAARVRPRCGTCGRFCPEASIALMGKEYPEGETIYDASGEPVGWRQTGSRTEDVFVVHCAAGHITELRP